MVRSIALALAVVCAAAGFAAAQTPEEQAACTDDAFRVCPHTIPDRERTFQCMVSQRDTLSLACRTAINNLLPPEPAPQKATARRKTLSKSSSSEPVAPDQRPKKGPINLAPPGR
jgi:hypothetical protein